MIEFSGIVILIAGIVIIGFIIWLIKESRDSDRDFETLKRFRHAEIQGKWAMMEYKHRLQIREDAEEMQEVFGLEAAESYYEFAMSTLDRTSILDDEYKAIIDGFEKPKRKNDDYTLT